VSEPLTGALQVATQLDVVVNFAVEAQPVAPVGASHRLMPQWAQVQDAQTPKAEAPTIAFFEPVIIGTAMAQQSRHR
jgi:hypothetical protein